VKTERRNQKLVRSGYSKLGMTRRNKSSYKTFINECYTTTKGRNWERTSINGDIEEERGFLYYTSMKRVCLVL
jgi:hypothetical protein